MNILNNSYSRAILLGLGSMVGPSAWNPLEAVEGPGNFIRKDLEIRKSISVTNLSDSGPGSLRDALKIAKEGTRIEFKLAGVIKLESPLDISKPGVMIDGASAPAPGICLTHAGIRIKTHDVTIKHLLVVPGDGVSKHKLEERDGITVYGPDKSPIEDFRKVFNVNIENCTIFAATDGGLDTYGPVNGITVRNCIIANTLWNSQHSDIKRERSPVGHSLGCLIGRGAEDIRFIGNLFINNGHRNPAVQAGVDLVFVGNTVAFYGDRPTNALDFSDTKATDDKITRAVVSGNYFIPNSSSISFTGPIFNSHPLSASKLVIFQINNHILSKKGVQLIPQNDLSLIGPKTTRVDAAYKAIPAVDLDSLQIPKDPMNHISSKVGMRPDIENPLHRMLLDQIKARQGEFLDAVVSDHSKGLRSLGGYPILGKNTFVLPKVEGK